MVQKKQNNDSNNENDSATEEQKNSSLAVDTLETVNTCASSDESLDLEIAASCGSNTAEVSAKLSPSSPPILKKEKNGYAQLKDESPSHLNSTPRRPFNDILGSSNSDHPSDSFGDCKPVTVENHVHTNGDSSKSKPRSLFTYITLALMGKGGRLLALIGLAYIVFTTLTSGFLFESFLNKAGIEELTEELKAQVKVLESEVTRLEGEVSDLTVQVDRLENAVEDLSDQNDRYEQNNINLAANLTLFKGENDKLQNTIGDYTEQNINLNTTIKLYQQQNNQLFENVALADEQNKQLTSNIVDLNAAVDDLENVSANLSTALDTSAEIVTNLTVQVEALEATRDSLNSTVLTLTAHVQEFALQVDRMDDTIQELTDVVSFLNTTATDIDRTFDATVTFIDTIIERYRSAAIAQEKAYWETIRGRWGQDIDNTFGNKPFAKDTTLPIGDADYPEVMEHLDEVVFQPMCLNLTDFETFLIGEFFPVFEGDDYTATGGNLTVSNLSQGIFYYTINGLFKHYFGPAEDDVDDQVTAAEWEKANYECENLVAIGRGFSFY